ncbi:MAG: hypothetical protein R2865_15070 [Deinococcales bacterium]
MSADGSMAAWQGVSRGLDAVFIRNLNTNSTRVLRNSKAALFNSLTRQCAHTAFIRKTSSDYSVLLYKMGVAGLKLVYRSSLILQNTQQRSRGNLVAWLQHTSRTGVIFISKNIGANTINNEISSNSSISSAHI